MSATWPDLPHSKKEVRRAGELLRRWYTGALVDEGAVVAAQDVLTAWRAAHAFVRNTAQMGLRSRAATRSVLIEVTSRTKNRTSIYAKLAERPDLQLDAMRDIAGARAVVDTLESQARLLEAYGGHDDVAKVHDYRDGKGSGYRAVHVDLTLVDRHTTNPERRTRRVELQIRTRAQHEWADFVEQVGRQLGYRLKQGRGPESLLAELQLLSHGYAEQDALTTGHQLTTAWLDRLASRRRRIMDEWGVPGDHD